MYHHPRNDTHVGRHARRQQRPTAPQPVFDSHGRRIPAPPPRPLFGPGALVRAAARHQGPPTGALVLVCWEALTACNPAALEQWPEARDAAYRPVAVDVAGRLAGAVSQPQTRHVAGWIADSCEQHLGATALRGRSRRAAVWMLTSGEWRWTPPRRRTPR